MSASFITCVVCLHCSLTSQYWWWNNSLYSTTNLWATGCLQWTQTCSWHQISIRCNAWWSDCVFARWYTRQPSWFIDAPSVRSNESAPKFNAKKQSRIADLFLVWRSRLPTKSLVDWRVSSCYCRITRGALQCNYVPSERISRMELQRDHKIFQVLGIKTFNEDIWDACYIFVLLCGSFSHKYTVHMLWESNKFLFWFWSTNNGRVYWIRRVNIFSWIR